MAIKTVDYCISVWKNYYCKSTDNFIHFANAFTVTFCSHVTAQSSAEWSHVTVQSSAEWSHVTARSSAEWSHVTAQSSAEWSVHATAQSSAEWSQRRSPSNLVSGHDSTMRLIVCTLPHWHLSDDAMCHLWRLVAQEPCPVRKRFNTDHAECPRLKAGTIHN